MLETSALLSCKQCCPTSGGGRFLPDEWHDMLFALLELLRRATHQQLTHDWESFAAGRKLFRAQWLTIKRMMALLFTERAVTPTMKDIAHITSHFMHNKAFNLDSKLTSG